MSVDQSMEKEERETGWSPKEEAEPSWGTEGEGESGCGQDLGRILTGQQVWALDHDREVEGGRMLWKGEWYIHVVHYQVLRIARHWISKIGLEIECLLSLGWEYHIPIIPWTLLRRVKDSNNPGAPSRGGLASSHFLTTPSTMFLWSKHCYHPILRVEETEVWSDEVTCPRAELFFKLSYWFVVKGYNSEAGRWKRCVGQGMGKGKELPCPLQGHHSPDSLTWNRIALN